MSQRPQDECCPKFDPTPWDLKTVTWENKLFVKDRVFSIFHIPLTFGSVMRKNMALIEAANAVTPNMIVVADENSAWGCDVYIDVPKEVPGAQMATLSGTFLTKVFEGSYGNMRRWIAEMHTYAASQGHQVKKLLFYYTTCPKCAKKWGKNYVVILAQI